MEQTTSQDAPLILLADDDSTFRLLAAKALEKAGFRVHTTENGIELLSVYQDILPDIVLLDIMMPGMDGFECCRKLRSMPEGELIPILMLTSLDNLDSITKAYDSGATDFVTKPVNWLILGHRLNFVFRANTKINQALAEKLHHLSELYATVSESEPSPSTNDRFSTREWLKSLYALRMIVGDEIFFTTINRYLAETPPVIEVLWRAVRLEDKEMMLGYIEQLRSKSANLGIQKINTMCDELTSLGETGSFEPHKRILSSIEVEFYRVEESIKQEFLSGLPTLAAR